MKAASIAWRLALAALLFTLAWQVWQLRRAPQWLSAELDRQAALTRAAALAAIADTRRDLLAESGALRADLRHRADRLLDLSDRRLIEITARLDAQLTAANQSLASVAQLRADVAALLPPVHNTLDVVSENADLLGRCATPDPATGEWIGNPDCLANRLVPALHSFERTSAAGERIAAAIEKETPATAGAVRSASQSVATIAGNFARPTGWLKSVFFTAARAVRKCFGF